MGHIGVGVSGGENRLPSSNLVRVKLIASYGWCEHNAGYYESVRFRRGGLRITGVRAGVTMTRPRVAMSRPGVTMALLMVGSNCDSQPGVTMARPRVTMALLIVCC